MGNWSLALNRLLVGGSRNVGEQSLRSLKEMEEVLGHPTASGHCLCYILQEEPTPTSCLLNRDIAQSYLETLDHRVPSCS